MTPPLLIVLDPFFKKKKTGKLQKSRIISLPKWLLGGKMEENLYHSNTFLFYFFPESASTKFCQNISTKELCFRYSKLKSNRPLGQVAFTRRDLKIWPMQVC